MAPSLLDAVADLAWGGGCPGCGRAGLGLCPGCRQVLSEAPAFEVARTLPGFPSTWCRGNYAGELRGVLVSCKERDGLGLVPILARLLAGSVSALLTGRPGEPVVLVPVPSSTAGERRRGFDLTGMMARQAAARLRRGGGRVGVWAGLRQRRGLADQAGLGERERLANLRDGLTVRRGGPAVAVVLIDDIVTTGATLAESAGALVAAGHRVLGAAVVASTPRRIAARPQAR